MDRQTLFIDLIIVASRTSLLTVFATILKLIVGGQTPTDVVHPGLNAEGQISNEASMFLGLNFKDLGMSILFILLPPKHVQRTLL